MPLIWYPPIVSPADRIGSTDAPGTIGTRYAGFAVLNPGSFFEDALPAIVSATAPAIAARAASRFIRDSPFLCANSSLGGAERYRVRPRRVIATSPGPK